MGQSVIIFGASEFGKNVSRLFNSVDFFCDNDQNKWGKRVDGIEIIPPDRLKEIIQGDTLIIIVSSSYPQITEQLIKMGILQEKILVLNHAPNEGVGLSKYKDIQSISLGHFLSSFSHIPSINNLTFSSGSSHVLDYIFLKALCVKFKINQFLEIGTLMGEGISEIAEIVEKCYEISLPDDHFLVQNYFENVLKKHNFSRFFSKNIVNITSFQSNSIDINFKQFENKVDLVFVDGDHSYNGIYTDTRNVFNYVINPNDSFVVWHDFKNSKNELISTTLNAVYDAVPSEYHSNIFTVEGNLCGIYIPEKYINKFKLANLPDEIFSYQLEISVKNNKL